MKCVHTGDAGGGHARGDRTDGGVVLRQHFPVVVNVRR